MKSPTFLFLLSIALLFSFSCNTSQPTAAKKDTPANPTTTTTPENPGEADNSPTTTTIENTPAATTPDTRENSDNTDITSKSKSQEMIREINKLRKDPKGYIPSVEAYLVYYKQAYPPFYEEEKRVAQELIAELRNTAPMQEVRFHEALYQVAKAHGDYLKSLGTIPGNPHLGKGNTRPDQRIKSGTGLVESGENFGIGHVDARNQLIFLLVDSPASNRGHRKNILDPDWNLMAPYSIGAIGQDEGCWLQLFARDKQLTTTSSTPTSTISLQTANQLVDEAAYMTAEEKEMVKEINLLRSDPKAYITHINAYKGKVSRGELFIALEDAEEIEVANELIEVLKKTPPLSILKPDPKLYQVSVEQGQFIKANGIQPGTNPHLGKNQQKHGARIKSIANMSPGGENYIDANYDVRTSLIRLLVDGGIENRGHRLALLDPVWSHAAAHTFGPVNVMGVESPKSWLQNYGRK